jgi:hypothetical protein
MSRRFSELALLLVLAVATVLLPIACGSSNNPTDGPVDNVNNMTHG